jgi:very-short-patch-repair endonuclease
LAESLGSAPERRLFETYCKHYGPARSFELPALIPQVYLHYDPYTRAEIAARAGEELPRQRMDFLLLFPDRVRVVIEVDGKQHYSTDDRAEPRLYAQMMAEDRRLRLSGYEIYRFGGQELTGAGAEAVVSDFFGALLGRTVPRPRPRVTEVPRS